MLDDRIRQYLAEAPLGRLATVDPDGQPHVVPVCFAVRDEYLVTPIDEKDKRVTADRLQRVRNVETNPRVALVVDHYAEDWDDLGWVHLRGPARIRQPEDTDHHAGADALESKYPQYVDHDLSNRPLIQVQPRTVRSWGTLALRIHAESIAVTRIVGIQRWRQWIRVHPSTKVSRNITPGAN